jgi:hypothetical protein
MPPPVVFTLRDRRLNGNFASPLTGVRLHRYFDVDQNISLESAFRYLDSQMQAAFAEIAGTRRVCRPGEHMVDILRIFCHGYEACLQVNTPSIVDTCQIPSMMGTQPQMSYCTRSAGGFGLEICREGINLRNVAVFRHLEDKVGRIVIYACAAAQTDPTREGLSGDGRRLCQEIAERSNAHVYASEYIQTYHTYTHSSFGIQTGQYSHFEEWEGNLLHFYPRSTTMPQVVVGQARPS